MYSIQEKRLLLLRKSFRKKLSFLVLSLSPFIHPSFNSLFPTDWERARLTLPLLPFSDRLTERPTGEGISQSRTSNMLCRQSKESIEVEQEYLTGKLPLATRSACQEQRTDATQRTPRKNKMIFRAKEAIFANKKKRLLKAIGFLLPNKQKEVDWHSFIRVCSFSGDNSVSRVARYVCSFRMLFPTQLWVCNELSPFLISWKLFLPSLISISFSFLESRLNPCCMMCLFTCVGEQKKLLESIRPGQTGNE